MKFHHPNGRDSVKKNGVLVLYTLAYILVLCLTIPLPPLPKYLMVGDNLASEEANTSKNCNIINTFLYFII